MDLFDNIVRTDAGPASHSEDEYSYYNRSARPAAESIRRLLQQWFSRYPKGHQPELRARFKADFQSAFFELFLYELILRLGAVPVPHAVVETGISARPDFRVDSPRGATSYLEARVARDESAAETRNRRVLGSIYDQINKLPIADWFLRIVHLRIAGSRQPALRRFKKELLAWLESLDYEAHVSRRETPVSLDELPSWRFADDVFEIEISAIPVSRERRGAPDHRPIGIYPVERGWQDTGSMLRKALERKGTKFGQLSAPYVIAVNCLSSFEFDRIDQMEALFGKEQFLMGPEDEEPVMIRRPDGFWFGPKGPRHTRVSAVLFCQVGPWNVHKAQLCLYHNPWAQYPYDGELNECPRAVPRGSKMDWLSGLDPAKVFDLPDDWPGE
jgi:hypothetical protein